MQGDIENFYLTKYTRYDHIVFTELQCITREFDLKINDDVDSSTILEFNYYKFQIDPEAPEENERNTVIKISKQDFYSIYHKALKNLKELDIQHGEQFALKEYRQEYDSFIWFFDHKNPMERKSLRIVLTDSVEWVRFRLERTRDFTKRPGARKKGKPVEWIVLKKALQLSVNFLFDSKNFGNNYASFVRSFKELLTGTSSPFDILSSDHSLNGIKEKLQHRICTIESRLINSDNDAAETRLQMRGELEGLKFALSLLNE